MMITKAVATITTMAISGGLKSTETFDGGDFGAGDDDWPPEFVVGDVAGDGAGDNPIMTDENWGFKSFREREDRETPPGFSYDLWREFGGE